MVGGQPVIIMLLEELRRRAKEKLEKVKSNPNSSESDIKKANDVVIFYSKEMGVKEAPPSLVRVTSSYLGFPDDLNSFRESYKELIDDIDRRYIYVNPDDLIRGK